jgi:galactokinase
MSTQSLLTLDPVPTLLSRLRAELAADFVPDKSLRLSRAPGRLDVMGGIADYTGSLVCEATLDRAAAVALQERDDRNVQVFSFNLLDEHKPFTLRIPLDAIATADLATLRKEFAEPGRRWAGYLVGCLFILHEQGYVDLGNPQVKGLNLALFSTVPLGAGVSSSAAIEVATMTNLLAHFGVDGTPGVEPRNRLQIANCRTIDPMKLSAMCQMVENRVVGAPCGIMDQVSSCFGQPGALLRMVCQPHEIQPPLLLPSGIRAIGINSNVKHSVGGGQYGRTRCAAFMGHTIILNRMARMGKAAGRTLHGDPMNGYLANLDPEDYKRLFREHVPELIRGDAFLAQYGPTIDTATTVDPDVEYTVQHATDHHVLEARRVRNFTTFLEDAAAIPDPSSHERKVLLDKAGHLMYASHLSYTNDAMLGAQECDLLVKLVRHNEKAGLYGAKITGGGSGGTVAVLCDISERADEAIAQIMADYERQTGKKPEAFLGSSPGAWHAGTSDLRL